MMNFEPAAPENFEEIRDFYWALIEAMADKNDTIGWKKGVYPTDLFLRDSLKNQELFTLKDESRQTLLGCVIVNSAWNEGYEGVPWSIVCRPEEILVPHALAIAPHLQGQGLGQKLVQCILQLAQEKGKHVVRLDILGTNKAAEALYTGMGFSFVQAKQMFYEDTGWTEYKMFERSVLET